MSDVFATNLMLSELLFFPKCFILFDENELDS